MALKLGAEALNDLMAEIFPQLGGDFMVEHVDEDVLRARLRVSEAHLRPGGTVSGPSIFALADLAVYMAVLARIGPVALAVTTNASLDFLRKPAAGCDLLAECRVLKLGRVLAVADVLIYSEGDARPVARASMTYSIPPERAKEQ